MRARRTTRPGSNGLGSEEARKVAGGMGDAVSAVQSLPGVGTSTPGGAGLVVWGAAPRETTTLVDGIPVPGLFHLGGFRSIVESSRVQRLELTPGAYGPEQGRALGGVVEVTTAEPSPTGLHGRVGADLLDASALVSSSLGPSVSASASARFGYLDRLADAVVDPRTRAVLPIPRYGDWQLRLHAKLRESESLDVSWLGATDRLTQTTPLVDPSLSASETHHQDFQRLGLIYRRSYSDGSSLTLTPYGGVNGQQDTASARSIDTLLKRSAVLGGVRGEYRAPLSKALRLVVGTDSLATATSLDRVGSLNNPRREGDLYVFGQPPHDELTGDSWKTLITDLSAYAALEASLGRLQLRPGVRVDMFDLEVSRLTPRVGQTPAVGSSELIWTADPRLSASFELTENLSLVASGGVYHQAPDPVDLSAVFGSPKLGLQRALTASAGVVWRLPPFLTAEVTGFSRWLDGLSERSPKSTPPLAGAITSDGTGWNGGMQATLRARMGQRFSGWVSYLFSHSTRERGPDQPTRLFDYDQPHVLTAVLSSTWGAWSFGARVQYASGFPRTPVLGGFLNTRTGAYEPVFGEQNTSRLPPFFRVDLHAEHTFEVMRGLRVWVDLQNVTNRKNPQEVVYDYDFKNAEYLTGLPFLAVVGLGLEW